MFSVGYRSAPLHCFLSLDLGACIQLCWRREAYFFFQNCPLLCPVFNEFSKPPVFIICTEWVYNMLFVLCVSTVHWPQTRCTNGAATCPCGHRPSPRLESIIFTPCITNTQLLPQPWLKHVRSHHQLIKPTSHTVTTREGPLSGSPVLHCMDHLLVLQICESNSRWTQWAFGWLLPIAKWL